MLRGWLGPHWIGVLLLVASLVGFFFHCRAYDFTQDDAYISFTYARNLAMGKGLVFNDGEQVEGYTNFLWTLGMTIPHLLGIDVVAVAKTLGSVAAVALFAVVHLLSIRLHPTTPPFLHALAPLLLAANGGLAFWTWSGMETLPFVLLITLGAYQYSRELTTGESNLRVGLIFGLAALTRPEGLLYFGLTGLHRLVAKTRQRTFAIREFAVWTLPFLALVIPHVLFRYAYYGYPLPNTFYAKSGTLAVNWINGLHYAEKFLLDYGFWGIGLLTPVLLLFCGRQRSWHSYQALLILANTAYVIAVGGDVLHENRFFLTTLPLIYLALQSLLQEIYHFLAARYPTPRRRLAFAVAALFLTCFAVHRTYDHARPSIIRSLRLMGGHNRALEQLARYANDLPSPAAVKIATTTIGIPKYFTDAYVLDLIGLTSAKIAHRRFDPPPGLTSPYVYRGYDVEYVMASRPDLIFFQTGVKPVYLAEKALFLSRHFRRDYYLTHITDSLPVFARKPNADSALPDQLFPTGDFIEHYVRGLNAKKDDDVKRAIDLFQKCIDSGPADFAYPYLWMGALYYDHGEMGRAYEHFSHAIAIDSCIVKAHTYLAAIELAFGRPAEAVKRARRATALSPRSHYNQFVIGLSLLKAGRPRESVPPLTEATRLVGEHELNAASHLGEAYRQMGEREKAEKLWTSILEADPAHRQTREYRAAAEGDL